MPKTTLVVASTLSVLSFVLVGCGDRAPPALWPEPPPPTLAEPIGVQHGGRAPDPVGVPPGGAATEGSGEAHSGDATSAGRETGGDSGDAAPAHDATADAPKERDREGAARGEAERPPAR